MEGIRRNLKLNYGLDLSAQSERCRLRRPGGVSTTISMSSAEPDRLPGSNQTACRVMADVADDSSHDVGSDPQQALLNFDREFSRLEHRRRSEVFP